MLLTKLINIKLKPAVSPKTVNLPELFMNVSLVAGLLFKSLWKHKKKSN